MFGFRFWGFSVLYTLGAASLIGIPTVLIPNTLYLRVRVLRRGCPVNFNSNTQ